MSFTLRKAAYSLYRKPFRWQKNWYGWYDPRNWYSLIALSYRYQLSLNQLREGLQIWHDIRRSKRYLCTLPRSGTNYINCVLASASNIEAGGTGNYVFQDNRWIYETQLVYPAVLNKYLYLLSLPGAGKQHPNLYLESHHPLVAFPLVRDPNLMKVVFTVRDITQQLISWISHDGYDLHAVTEDFIRTRYLEQSMQYFNYWGDFIQQPEKLVGQDYIFFSYEDLIKDPLATLWPIIKFWKLAISEESLKLGIELSSKEQMKLRIPVSALKDNRRVTLQKGAEQAFSPTMLENIYETLGKRLQYNFGYEY